MHRQLKDTFNFVNIRHRTFDICILRVGVVNLYLSPPENLQKRLEQLLYILYTWLL